MQMRPLYILLLSVFTGPVVRAQTDSVLLTNDFLFRDGVYFNFAALRANTPDIPVERLEGRLVTNAETLVTKSDYLAAKTESGPETIALNRIWAVCLDGLVYLPVPTSDSSFAAFAQLQTLGRLGYFDYPETVRKKVRITAYNPVNGLPFRSADVPHPEVHIRPRVLDFKTGEVCVADTVNLKRLTAEDAGLRKTWENPTGELTPDACFRLITAFNKQNAFYLPQ